MNQLLFVKRGIPQVIEGKLIFTPYSSQEQDIMQLEEQIRKAPEEEVFYSLDNIEYSIPFHYTYKLSNGTKVTINADTNSIYIIPRDDLIFQPERWVIEGDANPGEPVGTTLNNIKLSRDEAVKAAGNLVNRLGLINLGISNIEKARLTEGYTYKVPSEGWNIKFTPQNSNSIPVDLTPVYWDIFFQYETSEHLERWPQEELNIYVDETGIKRMVWRYPVEAVETLNTNVALLDFEEIKEKIKSAIKYSNWAVSSRETKLLINGLTLTNVSLPRKDDPSHQILVPAWLIYYREDDWAGENCGIFAINAIDGSIIDLTLYGPPVPPIQP